MFDTGESLRHATTINNLPDNALLEIFDFYRKSQRHALHRLSNAWKWHSLVHVCHRWRQIVLASPIRLHLRILCTLGAPVRDLGIWPDIPIVIKYYYPDMDYHSRFDGLTLTPDDELDVIAALGHPHRVWAVVLGPVTGSQLGKVAAVMQEPFPVLTCLKIHSNDEDVPVLPIEFLGGSAPCLQDIHLHGIPYPALPTLLFSTSNLVNLELYHIPPTGYLPPEVMVACLAASPKLDKFILEFQMATTFPERIHPPPLTRTVLPQPSLTLFRFRGDSDYLEDLLARIDGPETNWLLINYIHQPVGFRFAHLSRFIDRSIGPKLTLFEHARILFEREKVCVDTYTLVDDPDDLDWRLARRLGRTSISCNGIDWQFSHSIQALSQISATLSAVVHLELDLCFLLTSPNDVEWLVFLLQFPTMRTLRTCRSLAGHVALALETLALEDITGEMVSEVMPGLELICLEGQPASSVERFIAARRLSDRPVTFIHSKELYGRRESRMNT